MFVVQNKFLKVDMEYAEHSAWLPSPPFVSECSLPHRWVLVSAHLHPRSFYTTVYVSRQGELGGFFVLLSGHRLTPIPQRRFPSTSL